MSAYSVTHGLKQSSEASDRNPASRSDYSYIFTDLADAKDAGRFTGTDDQATLQRLKDFEVACRLPPGVDAERGLTITLAAAMTYFGQFVNHDISAPVGGLLVDLGKLDPVGIIGTADPVGLTKDWRADVDTILLHFRNEHARPLTLASLYGDGPGCDDPGTAALYQKDGKRFCLATTSVSPRHVLETQTKQPDRVFHATDAPDFPRKDGKPQIADLRNDGNLILSQLHLAFMLFHNKVVTKLETLGTPGTQIFDKARQLVTLHYHWMILNDFLPSVLSLSVQAKPLSQWTPKPFPAGTVPMEFTTAAFRFGHSMVGRAYDFNANFGRGGRMSPSGASLLQLFAFTSNGKMADTAVAGQPSEQLPDHWVIDWDRLTRDQPGGGPNDAPGQAESIDLTFAPEMLTMVGESPVPEQASIFFRNLVRGFHRRMPFGQDLAGKYGARLLSRDELAAAMPQHLSPDCAYPNPVTAAAALGILDQTPAWLYLMCEAHARECGCRVGPTASGIIADTIVSLMLNDPASILQQEGGNWHPKDSPMTGSTGKPLDSIRAFLLCATDNPAPV